MAEPKDTTSFFRKVVKFVANPSTDWTELDAPVEDTRESDYAKGELKAMIERKRRNDFVRKREFDMLRKVRREGLSSEQIAALGGSSRLDDSQAARPRHPPARQDAGMSRPRSTRSSTSRWWARRQLRAAGAQRRRPGVLQRRAGHPASARSRAWPDVAAADAAEPLPQARPSVIDEDFVPPRRAAAAGKIVEEDRCRRVAGADGRSASIAPDCRARPRCRRQRSSAATLPPTAPR